MPIAHPRGGSEKGEAWYKAGYKTTKPNTWKDFISCAEYLVQKGYTSPERLAGTGTSAGGILISRAITERPDLFKAAVCNVGCANALRMEFSPNGPVNTPEFGTVKDPDECQALFEMDGVQHVQKGVKYPAVMGVGGWNDPRVAAWEPGKFVAALQAATASGNPVLMKVNYDNGHFTEEKIVTFKNFASQFAFLLWQTGHKEFQPGELGRAAPFLWTLWWRLSTGDERFQRESGRGLPQSKTLREFRERWLGREGLGSAPASGVAAAWSAGNEFQPGQDCLGGEIFQPKPFAGGSGPLVQGVPVNQVNGPDGVEAFSHVFPQLLLGIGHVAHGGERPLHEARVHQAGPGEVAGRHTERTAGWKLHLLHGFQS